MDIPTIHPGIGAALRSNSGILALYKNNNDNKNLIIENETMEPDAHIGKYYMLRAMQALKKLRGTNAGICLQKHLLAPMMSSAGT
jgi:hypothetical protein